MQIIIRSYGRAVPKRHCLNSELPAELETSDEWIVSHTGIKARYLVDDTESVVTLGVSACNQAISSAGVNPEEIGLVLCSTTTPAYVGFPSTACVIQAQIGAKNATCYDITAACTGFIYALDNACAMMKTRDIKYAMICSSETLSRVTDWTDRSTCVLFGDAAGAVLLERIDDGEYGKNGVGSFITGSDGSGAEALYLGKDGFLHMDGHVVYDFAVSSMTKVIKEIMEKEGLTEDDVDYFVCHQANERILRASSKRLGFSFDKFVCTMGEYGNTSSASIPVTLADMQAEGKIKKGSLLVFAAFGAGLTWGATVIRF